LAARPRRWAATQRAEAGARFAIADKGRGRLWLRGQSPAPTPSVIHVAAEQRRRIAHVGCLVNVDEMGMVLSASIVSDRVYV